MEQHKREVHSRIPGASLKVIGNCGHLMPIDQPKELADSMQGFVSPLRDAAR